MKDDFSLKDHPVENATVEDVIAEEFLKEDGIAASRDHSLDKTVTSRDILVFVLASLVGVFLFLIPIPYNGTFTIPIGIIINWVSDLLVVGEFSIANLLVLIFISASCLLSIVGVLFKPAFIMNNPKIKAMAFSKPLYMVSKFVGLIAIVLTYFEIGPEAIYSGATGGSMMGVSAVLVSVVFVIAFAMPLLTDFGIMEFVGVLIRKFVRVLFTCPGRSAIDLMTSWFGASNAAVILTTRQYESGYYTGREAAVISTNFSLVSIPFCYVIAKLINVEQHFTIWYVMICVVGMMLAVITPRIWPLRFIPDTYDAVSGKQINEELPEGVGKMKWALNLAGKRAQKGSVQGLAKSGIDIYLSMFLDLIPLVMAWGTVVLVLVEYTPVFQIASIPLGYYMQLLGIENAMKVAPAALVGFADMYIPALMLANEAAEKTRFILGAVSLIQIIYMTEVGVLIVKSRVPMNAWKLFVVFLERTLISLPLITLFANLFVF